MILPRVSGEASQRKGVFNLVFRKGTQTYVQRTGVRKDGAAGRAVAPAGDGGERQETQSEKYLKKKKYLRKV